MGLSAISRRVSELLGVTFFGVALIWLVALVTYEPADAAWFFATPTALPPANFVGRIGAFLAELSYQALGYASYVIPAVLVVLGWNYFWCRPIDAAYTKLVGSALFLSSLSAFFSLAFGEVQTADKKLRAGGYVGHWFSSWLAEYLNRTGSAILIVTVLFLAIILSTQLSFGRLFAAGLQGIGHQLASLWIGWRQWRHERQKEAQRREVMRKHMHRIGSDPTEGDRPTRKPAAARPAAAPAGTAPASSAGSKQERLVTTTPYLPLLEPEPKSPAERRRGGYTFPPTALLDAPKSERKIDERELMQRARLLEEKCREFAVEGAVIQIHPGPVVTTFEFKPDAGVKYSKVTGLADDLCLAMQAESVLIERIAGKSTVGIQMPNEHRELISLRELLESEKYRHASSKLTVVLGKTIHGDAFVADLAEMPHLLVAGSTGTGKSVGLNCMITSVLYRATADEVRMILIDPKRLELGVYEGIPHLLAPVVTDPKQASNALRWAVREMEERYKTLAGEGVRNIDQYNRNVRHLLESKEAGIGPEALKPLPYILVVIDELADLMMVASQEVEESIARLAQMARAVGIHLVFATQRPSVDVITGLIKANLPARLSFRVSSKVDSRTILDGNGAEQLLGRGDMLFLPPASSRFVRLHGPYVSEQETARLASFLRKQGQPAYDETITTDDKTSESVEFDKDDLYDEAARIVVGAGQASISYLQRRLRIGFSRAARLIDMMEAEGLVSPAAGSKPREVLVDKHYFEVVDTHPR